jgi:hypothetical protein
LPKRTTPLNTKAVLLLLVLLPFGLGGCPKTKKVTKIPAAEIKPLQTATLAELLEQLREQAAAVETVNAVTELIPSTGSAYSGVIEEYHDVRAFVLAGRNESAGQQIRMIGQAPVVRRTVFDMVADLTGFRINIPPKSKFIVGSNRVTHRSDKPMENLRPQHLFEAILPVPPQPVSLATQNYLEENEFGGRRFYIVTEVSAIEEATANGALHIARKWWFDRTDLSLVRVQRFDNEGRLVTDIHYADWRPAGETRYPHLIEVVRPHDDYRLKLLVKEITLNGPMGPERFRLEQPAEVELIDLDELARKKAEEEKEESTEPPAATTGFTAGDTTGDTE